MPTTEMIVMVAVITAFTMGAIHLFRLVQAGIAHRTIRRVIDKDPQTAEALILRVTEPPSSGAGDDRTAVVLIAIGLAMIGASLIAGERGDWTAYGVGGALFPLLIGIALWLRHSAIERARRRGEPQ